MITDGDRKYMVQTLTMLMTHIQRPSLRHCLIVSKALHAKFKFLGDDISEVLYIVISFFLICHCKILGTGLYKIGPIEIIVRQDL